MPNINFTCPHCSHTTQLTSDRVGAKTICPSCKTQVVITPELPTPPPRAQTANKSDDKLRKEIWKQPAVVSLSIMAMIGVVAFILCLVMGASYFFLRNTDAVDDQSNLVEPDIIRARTLTGHSANINSVAFSPDGNRIVTGSNDTTAKLWDANNGDLLRTLTGHSAEVRSVAFSPDGNRIVTGSSDKTVKLWDANNGQLLRTLNRYGGSIQSVAFSPDGTKMGYGGISYPRGFSLHICDANTGDLQRGVTLAKTSGLSAIYSVVFSPDSKRVATGSVGSDQSIKIWDASTGDLIKTIKLDMGTLNLSFSPDGNRLAAPDKESVRIFDAKTCDLQRTITGKTSKSFLEAMNRGYSYEIKCVAFSPDGNHIVTGSMDRAVKIWNANTGHLLATLNGHTEPVNSVAFSPDGKRVVSVSDDETVRIWSVEK